MSLTDASIGDAALLAISEGIKESLCLESINLTDNIFEKKGLHALLNALRTRMTCKVLMLGRLQFDEEDAILFS